MAFAANVGDGVDGPGALRPRVFIATSTFGKAGSEPLNRLKERGVAFTTNPLGRTLTADEAARFLADVDGVIAGTEPLTRSVLAQARRLRVISRCGTGLDNVDLEAAAEFGITVAATTRAHVAAVAELTLGAMIALLRRIPQNHLAVKSGRWEKHLGKLLHGRTVGIIGLGKVGKAVVRALGPFNTGLLAYDPYPDTEFARAHGVEFVTLDELLQRAEIVSLHLPYSPELRHLLGRERLARMREGAYLVNTSRGGLVDEDALCDFLQQGRIAGAFIDTFEREPYSGRLAGLDNAILSPHVGAYAEEARLAMELEAVENLLQNLETTVPSGVIQR